MSFEFRVSSFGLAAALAFTLFASDCFASEEWRAIRYGEIRVGSVRIERGRENRDGKSLHKTVVERNFSYFQGRQVQYTVRETYLEDSDGALKEVAYLSRTRQGKTTIRGVIEGGKIKYTCVYPGKAPSQMESSWDVKAIGPNQILQRVRSKGFAEGTMYAYKTFSFSNCAVVLISAKVLGPARVVVGGKERELIRVAVEGADLVGADRKPLVRTRWYDREGALVMEEDPLFGKRAETSCTEAEASESDRGVLAATTMTGACRVSGKMIRPSRVDMADFLVRGAGKMKSADFKGPGQAGRKQADGIRVTVRLPKPKKTTRPCADGKMEASLEATYILDFDQGEVQTLAKRVVGSEKDTRKAAELLRVWTFENLARCPVNNGMASASVAVRERQGDAVEHAVVLAAMCRAVGIPARLAGGLRFVGGVGWIHAWVEIWSGEWIPIDATQRSPCDAARIRFASSDLKDIAPDAVLVGLADMLQSGRLSVDVNAYSIAGRVVDMDNPDKGAHEMRGDTYYHRLYGFSVRKPPEFQFQERLPGIDAVVGIMGKGGMREKILVRASPSSRNQTLRSILRSLEATYVASDVRETKVGRMPALIAKMSPRGGRGYGALTCYIHAGDTILALESSDNTAAVRAAFELAMKSMRFE